MSQTQGIIESLSRSLFHVSIIALKDEADGVVSLGTVGERIRTRADVYVEAWKSQGLAGIRGLIEVDMRALSSYDGPQKLKLDVLVFAEIGMDPVNYLLAFSRLAPTQVVTHGHASTTGIPTLDYFISYKPFEVAHAQEHYSETLVTFSDFSPYDEVGFFPSFLCLPTQPVVDFDQLVSRPQLFDLLGLSEHISLDTIVYVCHQTLFKIIPAYDDIILFVVHYCRCSEPTGMCCSTFPTLLFYSRSFARRTSLIAFVCASTRLWQQCPVECL